MLHPGRLPISVVCRRTSLTASADSAFRITSRANSIVAAERVSSLSCCGEEPAALIVLAFPVNRWSRKLAGNRPDWAKSSVAHPSGGLLQAVRPPFPDQPRELLAPVGEIAEPVVTGAAGREQHDVSLRRIRHRPGKRLAQRAAALYRQRAQIQPLFDQLLKHVRRLAHQGDRLRLPCDPLGHPPK